MKECPKCGELLGDNADRCFNCQYDFKLGRVANNADRHRAELEMQARLQRESERQAELAKSREDALKKNALYEYETVFIQDNQDGTPDREAISRALRNYAWNGWRLHSMVCNEIGKSVGAISVAGFGFGMNATIDETILVFERRVKAEEV